MCISWNSWWRCSIARTSKICLDWHQKSDFELNFNIHLRHSCNQNMQNIVTWGQNMSANIEELACFSMGGLFSGVPPCALIMTHVATIRNLAYFDSHTVFIEVCNTAHKTDCRRKKPPKFVPLKLEICLNYAFSLDLCCYNIVWTLACFNSVCMCG